MLECGHEQRLWRDMISDTVATRRRCGECLTLAERSQAVPEVEKESAAEREQRLVARHVEALMVHLSTLLRCAEVPEAVYHAALCLHRLLWPEGSAPASRCRRPRPATYLDGEDEIARLLRRNGTSPVARAAAEEPGEHCRAALGHAAGTVGRAPLGGSEHER